MYLKEDPGSLDLQNASLNPDTQEIVNCLLLIHEEDWDLFRRIAVFIYQHKKPERVGVVEYHLQGYIQPNHGPDGSLQIAPYYKKLIQQLTRVYEHEETVLGFLRGTIVALFAYLLVNCHCDKGECFNNYCFVENHSGKSSEQADVAVLSHIRKEIEAYTCKMQPLYLESKHCKNLTVISKQARLYGYIPYTGAICFQNSEIIKQYLENCTQDKSINAYGLDNFNELAMSPANRQK